MSKDRSYQDFTECLIHATCLRSFRCKRALTQKLQYLTKIIYSQVHYTRQVTPWLHFKAQK